MCVTASIELPNGLEKGDAPWKREVEATIDPRCSREDAITRMHAFTNAVWSRTQDAMRKSIISDAERPVHSLRVELRARARRPKILGRSCWVILAPLKT